MNSLFTTSMMRRVLLGALAFWLGVFSGWAAANSRDMEREAEIEKELEQKHPELVEPFRAARIALDNSDHAEAGRLLQVVTAKAPDYDVALRRLGSCLVHEGKRAERLALCERAVALDRSGENLYSLAYNLVAGNSREEHRADYERALKLLLECRAKPHGSDLDTLALTAQVALGQNNLGEFQAANALLAAKFPNEMATHYFGAIEAALGEHWLRAEKEITKAEKLGLTHEAAQKFLDSGVHSRALWSRVVLDTALAFGVWVGGLVLLFSLGFLLSKLTLRQGQKVDVLEAITGSERLIRKLYRVVLNVAGVYYYVSLPIVIVLVIGIVAIILYAFLMIGRIPLKLMFLLGIGAIVTIIAMVKSLFVRVKSADPGRVLQRAEAKGLWELVEEVAQSVGTRPVNEIRITPGTELAVYERGTWRQKLGNEAQRILILGTGVLNGFKQNDFRCVLAHEYGHFSNRDTAGGDIALRVRTDMIKFYFAMRQAGQATYLNAAFHFLRIYNFIFRRISHGATRLQEILADRVAAQSYGATAFEAGLTHVVRRSLEFEAAANEQIKQSIETGRPLQNLYELSAPQGSQVAAELAKALNRETNEDDTHPSPRDRFRLVARLQHPSCTLRPGEVWDLFTDPEAIRCEMVAEIDKLVAPHRAQHEEANATATQAS
ncbi:MAG: M48 family metalloprotease [Limisphaerales bacterium]